MPEGEGAEETQRETDTLGIRVRVRVRVSVRLMLRLMLGEGVGGSALVRQTQYIAHLSSSSFSCHIIICYA